MNALLSRTVDTIRFLYRGPTPAELVILLRQKFWISLNTMNEWQRNAKCKQSLLWYIVLLYKMFHTKIPELTAMKIIILPPLLQKKGLKKPHNITTFWFSEVVNYHPNLLHQICTDLELALFMDLRCMQLHSYIFFECMYH